MSDDNDNRSLPTSELDYNLMLTDTVWGKSDVSNELKDRLTKYYAQSIKPFLIEAKDLDHAYAWVQDKYGGNANYVLEDVDIIMQSTGIFQVSGIKVITKKSFWGILGYYTRDMRLGNLSSFNNELETCRYHIDLANDLLHVDHIEPFLIALSRAATILETSQSKGGFLRRQNNTLRHENIQENIEPPKKGLMGMSGKENGGFG